MKMCYKPWINYSKNENTVILSVMEKKEEVLTLDFYFQS
jgi:hypothetical protein